MEARNVFHMLSKSLGLPKVLQSEFFLYNVVFFPTGIIDVFEKFVGFH